jgi:hypothetical protein
MVFCTISDFNPSSHVPDEEIEVPGSARMVQRTRSADSVSISYLADEALAAHERALSELMKGNGWKPIDGRSRRTAKGVTLQFEKDGNGAVAAIYDDPGSRLLGVQIHVQGSAP